MQIPVQFNILTFWSFISPWQPWQYLKAKLCILTEKKPRFCKTVFKKHLIHSNDLWQLFQLFNWTHRITVNGNYKYFLLPEVPRNAQTFNSVSSSEEAAASYSYFRDKKPTGSTSTLILSNIICIPFPLIFFQRNFLKGIQRKQVMVRPSQVRCRH